jgi:hypothetical protein
MVTSHFEEFKTGHFQDQTPWPLVHKRTIPTERPSLVDEILVPTFANRGMLCGQRGGSPVVINLSFLDHIFKITENKKTIGFAILTTVVMNAAIFWDSAPCSPHMK